MSAATPPTGRTATIPSSLRGILLVGHGTRDARGQAEFLQAAQSLAQRFPERPLETAFLELVDPPIAAAVRTLAARGVQHIDVVPLLLFSAGHALRDIPQAVAAALADFSAITTRQSATLDCSPSLLSLSAHRMVEALATVHRVPADETLLLMVGRGSLDRQANAEMARFARLRFEGNSAEPPAVGWYESCYLAMAQPRLEQALEVVTKFGNGRVIVQPHLLFAGELADRIQAAVELAARRYPQLEWLFTSPLGPHPLLIDALCERLNEAGQDTCQATAV
jgi:sirohydrochlorin cobaltochelatase